MSPHNSHQTCQKHEPDWSTVHIQSDGGELYIDLKCKHCGDEGCLGSIPQLSRNVNWEHDTQEQTS